MKVNDKIITFYFQDDRIHINTGVFSFKDIELHFF